MDDRKPHLPRRGRGAVSNATNRYERYVTEAVDDGWGLEEELPPLRTTVGWDATRTIIATNDSPDIGFDQSINPYRGCEHGCIYCYARPTHAWAGMSPGLDFETRLFAKRDAAKLLDRELRKPGYRCKVIVVGANTDPYQPIEREYKITRSILEVLAAFNQPCAIITKSALVARDLDILRPMAQKNLAAVRVTITTLDAELARKLEPRAATPVRRVETICRLAEAGVPAGVMVAPVIPFLTDAEMESILDAAAGAGATAAGYVLLRLPLEIKELFTEWLEAHAPGKARHVLNQLRESRGGALYDSSWGRRMKGSGIHAELLAKRFKLARARFGLNQPHAVGSSLDTSQFQPPPKAGDQLKLF